MFLNVAPLKNIKGFFLILFSISFCILFFDFGSKMSRFFLRGSINDY